MDPTSRRLYRSTTDRMISGVSGGIADYFDVDPVLVRVAWLLLAFLTAGVFAVAYLLLWIIVPLEETRLGISPKTHPTEPETPSPETPFNERESSDPPELAATGAEPTRAGETPRRRLRRRDRHVWVGVLLILIGLVLLMDNLNLIWWLNWRTFWPALLVGLGAILLWQRARV